MHEAVEEKNQFPKSRRVEMISDFLEYNIIISTPFKPYEPNFIIAISTRGGHCCDREKTYYYYCTVLQTNLMRLKMATSELKEQASSKTGKTII